MINNDKFRAFPAVAILRGITSEQLPFLAKVIQETGIYAVEITMNTPNANHLIASLKTHLSGVAMVGAGTVMHLRHLELALNAGAEFIVMPDTNHDVCSYCSLNDIPFFPGALTPNEIRKAWDYGPEMIKVFPANCFGPSYFKEVKAPLNDVKLLACAGVKTDNVKAYFENGAEAFAIGGSTIPLNDLNENGYKSIVENINGFKDALSA